MFEAFWCNVDDCTKLQNRHIEKNKKLGFSDNLLRHHIHSKMEKEEKMVKYKI
jgi:hypothetical protein